MTDQNWNLPLRDRLAGQWTSPCLLRDLHLLTRRQTRREAN